MEICGKNIGTACNNDSRHCSCTYINAERLFPGKTVILKEFLPKEEYFALLNKIDIAIFDTDRQIALGNIHTLIKNNVKLYLSETGVMYDYFLDNGVYVQGIKKLLLEDFNQFISVPPYDYNEKFKNWLEARLDYQAKIKQWENIFSEIKLQLEK